MKRFTIFVMLVLTLAFITINITGVNPAQSETLPGTKVDVYQEKKLVKSVLFSIGMNKYYISDKSEGVTMDAKPFIENGRTFVPIRFLSNALGVEDKNIIWDGAKKQVRLMAWNYVEMTVGNPVIVVRAPGMEKGNLKVIDVSPILKENEGRTYLPARYVAEALGYDVGWDEASQTVLCWPKGEVKPDVSAVVQKVVEERAKLEGKQVPITAPPGCKVTSMGYVVPNPENTKMKIEDKIKDVNLTLMIYLPSSQYAKERLPQNQWTTEKDFETQFNQAAEILTSKHGLEVAKAAIDYARKKTTRETELETKEFPLPEGGEIQVQGSYNAWYIVIQVWRV